MDDWVWGPNLYLQDHTAKNNDLIGPAAKMI